MSIFAEKILAHALSASGNDNERVSALNKLITICDNSGMKISVVPVTPSSVSNQPMVTKLIADKRELYAENKALREENALLKSLVVDTNNAAQTIKRKASQPSKTESKSDSFPWDEYPTLEEKAFTMMFRYPKKGVKSDIENYLKSQYPAAGNNTTFVNQRFIRGKPRTLDHLIDVKAPDDDSCTDWAELWKIGSVEVADNWFQRVLYYGGCADYDITVPKDWPIIDPNTLIGPEGRKNLRNMFHNGLYEPIPTKGEIKKMIKATPDKITRGYLKIRGVSGQRISDYLGYSKD